MKEKLILKFLQKARKIFFLKKMTQLQAFRIVALKKLYRCIVKDYSSQLLLFSLLFIERSCCHDKKL